MFLFNEKQSRFQVGKKFVPLTHHCSILDGPTKDQTLNWQIIDFIFNFKMITFYLFIYNDDPLSHIHIELLEG
jgi:hypothetical protein